MQQKGRDTATNEAYPKTIKRLFSRISDYHDEMMMMMADTIYRPADQLTNKRYVWGGFNEMRF